MKYLSFGINEINRQEFKKIKDIDDIKPTGGLWLTEQNIEETNYNPWIDYIFYNAKHLFLFKYNDPKKTINWNQPCSLITLKDKTNIFLLNNIEKYKYLTEKYQYINQNFSYQQLSNNYDGIFIDINQLINAQSNYQTREKFLKFGVNSLVLFNLNCIDYYQKGTVKIEPFNYESELSEPVYKIEYENKKRKVLKKERKNEILNCRNR